MPILKSVKIQRENSVAVAVKKLMPAPAGSDPEAAGDAPPRDPARLLAEAQAQAEALLNQAHTEAATIREQARKTGWETGYTEGTQAAEQELVEVMRTVRQMGDSAVEARNRFLRTSQNEISRLAVSIAEKIIGKELGLNPKLVTEIVAQAIKAAHISGACRIRVNPQDYDFLSPAWDSIPSVQPADRAWELVADKKVSRGGCLIEADGGILDAQIESQLEQMSLALTKLNS